MLKEDRGQGNTGVGGELSVATLQDTVDVELDGITPCLLLRKGCQNQVLLLRSLSLHSFPLVPISAVTF